MSINSAVFDNPLLPLLIWSWVAIACAGAQFAAVILFALQPWRSHLSPLWAALAIPPLAVGLWALVLTDGMLATYDSYYLVACGASDCADGDLASRIEQVGGSRFLASAVSDAHLRGAVLVAVTLALLTLAFLLLRQSGRRSLAPPSGS